jgi:hypothetical protein
LVADSTTLPNVPEVVPPAKLSEKALALSPLIALLPPSLTTIVSKSVLPDAMLVVAKLGVEFVALIPPTIT